MTISIYEIILTICNALLVYGLLSSIFSRSLNLQEKIAGFVFGSFGVLNLLYIYNVLQ